MVLIFKHFGIHEKKIKIFCAETYAILFEYNEYVSYSLVTSACSTIVVFDTSIPSSVIVTPEDHYSLASFRLLSALLMFTTLTSSKVSTLLGGREVQHVVGT